MSGLEKSKQQDEHGFTMGATSARSGVEITPTSHVNLRRPSWSLVGKSTKPVSEDYTQWGVTPERSSKKKANAQLKSMDLDGENEGDKSESLDDQDFVDSDNVGSGLEAKDDQDYDLEISEDDDFKPDDELLEDDTKKRKKSTKGGAAYKFLCEDDGDEMHYQKRLAEWAQKRRHLRWRVNHVSVHNQVLVKTL